MNQLSSSKSARRGALRAAALAAALYGTSLALAGGADPATPAAKSTDTKIAQGAAKPERTSPKKEKKKLTGAELYAINCNRCHPERYPTEWTAAQWKTIMLHMRVRANLPAAQAKTIAKYLQEESGS